MVAKAQYHASLTKEFLQREYVELKKSSADIANGLGCRPITVLRYLRQHGFTTRAKPRDRDLSAQMFGLLRVIEKVGNEPYEPAAWLCQCKCGTSLPVLQKRLVSGATRSCGCLARGTSSRNYKGTPHVSKSYWNALVRSARDRCVPLDITIEDAEEQFVAQGGTCALTGFPLVPSLTRHSTSDWNASLDRKNSDLGYSRDNIQWVHKDINRMKWHFTEEHFIAMCVAVRNHFTKKQRKRRAA